MSEALAEAERPPLPDPVQAAFPFEPRFLDVPGGRLAYIDEGPRDALPVVCVHGNPTWSFYWRALVAGLRDRCRVVALDHLGCGRSDKPQRGFDYRLASHGDNLRRLLDHLDLSPSVFAVHDWGGAIGMRVATLEPERAAGFVVSNTAAFRSLRIPPSIAMCKIPGLGELAVRGLNGFARAALVGATEKGLDATTKAGLLYPYDSWQHRIAVHRFVTDIPLHPGHPSWSTLVEIDEGLARLADRPMRILWGDADFCFGPPFRREWSRRFPDAEVSAWPDVGHYVMEDAPDRVLDATRAFLSPLLRRRGEA